MISTLIYGSQVTTFLCEKVARSSGLHRFLPFPRLVVDRDPLLSAVSLSPLMVLVRLVRRKSPKAGHASRLSFIYHPSLVWNESLLSHSVLSPPDSLLSPSFDTLSFWKPFEFASVALDKSSSSSLVFTRIFVILCAVSQPGKLLFAFVFSPTSPSYGFSHSFPHFSVLDLLDSLIFPGSLIRLLPLPFTCVYTTLSSSYKVDQVTDLHFDR